MVIDIMYLILHSGLAHECHRVCVCVLGGGRDHMHVLTHATYTHTVLKPQRPSCSVQLLSSSSLKVESCYIYLS